MKKTVELLAPAGSFEALEAALAAGADAIYLGGGQFGARRFAKNFEPQEMKRAVELAHAWGVSVYVTMNTLIKEEEFAEAMNMVDHLYLIGVDALILQDLGLFHAIKKRYPDLECHASTQMSAQSEADILALAKMGFERVVVAREMSLEALLAVRKKTDVLLEVFVHGALCTSLSGACLMSAALGGRSGNRGACAQPCRLSYEAFDGEGKKEKAGHLLSQKDLFTLDRLEELKTLAPVSLKIEGRMKSPAYVYGVVDAYRRGLSGRLVGNERDSLERLFNRGFTRGHLFEDGTMDAHDYPGHRGIAIGEVVRQEKGYVTLRLTGELSVQDDVQIGPRRMGGRVERLFIRGKGCAQGKPLEEVRFPFKHPVKVGEVAYKVYDVKQNKEIDEAIRQGRTPIPICGRVQLSAHSLPLLTFTDGDNHVTLQGQSPCQEAKKAPLSEDMVREQLEKLGDSPFVFDELLVDLDPGLFLPKAALNGLRRAGVEALLDLRKNRTPQRAENKSPLVAVKATRPEIKGPAQIVVGVHTQDQLDAVLSYDVQAIYAEEGLLDRGDDRVVFRGPHMGDSKGPFAVARRPGHLENAQIADFTLHAFNNESLHFFKSLGLSVATLSPELSLEEVAGLGIEGMEKELVVYGHLPLMTIKNRGKMSLEGVSELVGSKGTKFLILGLSDGIHQLMSGEPLALDIRHLEGLVHRLRLELTFETPEETKALLEKFLAYGSLPLSQANLYSGVR